MYLSTESSLIRMLKRNKKWDIGNIINGSISEIMDHKFGVKIDNNLMQVIFIKYKIMINYMRFDLAN